MFKTKQLGYGKIPEGVEEFWIVRQDFDGEIKMEHYRNDDGDWDISNVHYFSNCTPYDKEEVLKRAEFILFEEVLYIEEGTFWD